MDWYFDDAGSESGPHKSEEIDQRIRNGIVIAETLLWRKGMPDWQPAGEVDEFSDWFKRPPPLAHEARKKGKSEPDRAAPPVNVRVDSRADNAARDAAGPTPGTGFGPTPQTSRHALRRKGERQAKRRVRLGVVGLIGAVLVVVAIVAIGRFYFDADSLLGGGSGSDVALNQSVQAEETKALISDLLATPYADALRTVQQYEPDEFVIVVEQLGEAFAQGGSQQPVTELASEVTEFFINRHSVHVVNAPDELLKSVIETRLANVEAVLRVFPEQCAAFVVEGPDSLGAERQDVLAPLLFAETTALLQSFFEGKSAEITREPITDDDLTVILDTWLSNGVSVSLLESLEAPNADDPNFCPAVISAMRAIADAEGGSAERVRAAFVAQIVPR